MSRGADEQKTELINGLVAEAKERLGAAEGATVAAFIRRYYDRVPAEDIAERSRASLFGAALAHWKFGARRARGQVKLRLYNPTLEDHGWKSDHTVIEIVNDDMPFLVDSVTAELRRRDIGVLLIVHPILTVRRKGGVLGAVVEPGKTAADGVVESFMHVEISRQPSAAKRSAQALPKPEVAPVIQMVFCIILPSCILLGKQVCF